MRGNTRHRGASGRRAAAIIAAAGIGLAAWFAAGAGSASATRADGASHAHGSSRGHSRAAGTIHVIEHAVTDTVVQSGGGPDVTGNTLTFHNQVFNVADTQPVGHDQGFCMRIYPPEGSWECFWTTFLPRGQITVEGPYYDTINSVLAITGGTGAYRGARGQMDLKSRNGGKEYDFVFHIDR
jgi:allene oxide cyclase